MATVDEVQAAIKRLDDTATSIMRERDLLRKAVMAMEVVLQELKRELGRMADGQS